jgi:lantibiotic biosynthesis protein
VVTRPAEPPPIVVLRVATVPYSTLDSLALNRAAGVADGLLAREARLGAAGDRLSERLHAVVPAIAEAGPRRAALALRRRLHRNDGPPPEHELRAAAPALSASMRAALARHARNWRRLAESRERARRAFGHDLARARESLRELARTDFVQELVFLASRSLSDSLPAYLARPLSEFGRRERQTETALARYLARSAAKTTPFRLLGASGLATVGGRTTLAAARGVRRHVSPSLFALDRILAAVAAEPAAGSGAGIRVNPTLHRAGRAFVFWRDSPGSGEDRREGTTRERCEIRATSVLEEFIRQAHRDGRERAGLVAVVQKALVRTGGPRVTVEELDAVLRRLLDAGLLAERPEVPFNAADPMGSVRQFLEQGPRSSRGGRRPALDRVDSGLRRLELPGLSWAERSAAYHDVAAALGALAPDVAIERDDVFAVDASQAVTGRLNPAVLSDLERLVASYLDLATRAHDGVCPRRPGGRGRLAAAFRDRFGVDRAVPLGETVEAMRSLPSDGDPGAAPAVGPAPQEPHADDHAVWPSPDRVGGPYGRFMGWLLERIDESARTGVRRLAITRADRARLGLPPAGRAHPCDVIVGLAARNRTAIDRGDYLATLELMAAPGSLSARFAYLFGETHDASAAGASPVARAHRAWLERWSARHPERVLAEVAGLPRLPGIMNAGRRPRYADFEIETTEPHSALPRDRVLSLDDLAVVLPSTTGALELHSARLGRRVEPVYHSLVNQRFDPVGDFLVRLGTLAGVPAPMFRYFPGEGATRRHVPRLTLGRLVLSRERWNLRASECPRPDGDAWSTFAAVQRWRRSHGLPRRVFAHTDRAPKPLPVDLESPLLLPGLFQMAEGAHWLVLEEALPSPDGLWLRVGRRPHASELLLTLFRNEREPDGAASVRDARRSRGPWHERD